MMILFIMQLVVPLLLVGWFIMRPQRTLVAYGVQLIAFLLLLVATARVGMWLFPPWYTPYAAAITIVVVALFALHGGRFRTTSRASGEVVLTALFLATIAVSGTILIRTVTARNLPDGVQRVALEFPLTGADFLVVVVERSGAAAA